MNSDKILYTILILHHITYIVKGVVGHQSKSLFEHSFLKLISKNEPRFKSSLLGGTGNGRHDDFAGGGGGELINLVSVCKHVEGTRKD